jgi:hypothetical protein
MSGFEIRFGADRHSGVKLSGREKDGEGTNGGSS